MFDTPEEAKPVATFYLDSKTNELFDLIRGELMRLHLVGDDPTEEGARREYRLIEIAKSLQKKIETLDEGRFKDTGQNPREHPDLMLVSMLGFMVAPGISGLAGAFHQNFLYGYYFGKFVKNRNMNISITNGTMTAEDRERAAEMLRGSGYEPYDEQKHGKPEEEDDGS